MMRKLAARAAVIIITSEPEEALGNADRVMVIYKGETTLQKDAEGLTLKEMLVHAISSGEVCA
jgi:ABC-type sugar transport system ATPase subunit